MLPNFIIPGAQKSGTTALKIYLAQHPDIFVAPREVHYFDRDTNYRKGQAWYEAFFDKVNGKKAIGEKTPDYLYFEKVPERIHRLVPDVKLIFVFRNPVDRAYSHYWHKIRRNEEKKTFRKTVSKSGSINDDAPYIKIGRYVEQVHNYAQYFKNKQMLFLMAEDLKKDTKTTLKKVLKFLEVSPDVHFTDLQKKHIGGTPRSRLLLNLAHSKIFEPFGLFKDVLLRLNTKKGDFPPMDRNLRHLLTGYFEPYNTELQNLTGLDTNQWR